MWFSSGRITLFGLSVESRYCEARCACHSLSRCLLVSRSCFSRIRPVHRSQLGSRFLVRVPVLFRSCEARLSWSVSRSCRGLAKLGVPVALPVGVWAGVLGTSAKKYDLLPLFAVSKWCSLYPGSECARSIEICRLAGILAFVNV